MVFFPLEKNVVARFLPLTTACLNETRLPGRVDALRSGVFSPRDSGSQKISERLLQEFSAITSNPGTMRRQSPC